VSVVNWADCLVAMQQREIDAVSTGRFDPWPGWSNEDPYSAHRRAEYGHPRPYGNSGSTWTTPAWSGSSTARWKRIRRDGTWNTLYRKWLTVLGPAPMPPTPRYLGLMAEISEPAEQSDHESEEGGPGTQSADTSGAATTGRLHATQAVFRPDFDDDDDLPHISLGTIDTEPQERTVATRVLQHRSRQLGGGLVDIPRMRDIDPARSPDDQPHGAGVQAVLSGTAVSRWPAVRPLRGAEGASEGTCPHCGSPYSVFCRS